MQAKRKTVKKTARKSTGTKGAARSESGAAIAKRLAAISTAKAGTNPNKPVAVVAAELTRSAALAKKERAKLVNLPGFEAWWIDAAPEVTATLIETDTTWQRVRAGGRAGIGPKAAKEAEALKRELLTSARYVFRNEPETVQRLEQIAEGTGLADTALDLNALAAIVDADRRLFAAIPDFPKDAAKQARARAKELSEGLDPAAAAEAQEARNRAFWLAESVTSELNAALRFLWRKQPVKLAQLGVSYAAKLTRDSRARRAKSPVDGGGPAPKPA